MSAPMAQDIEQEFDPIRDIEFPIDAQKGFLDRALTEVEFMSISRLFHPSVIR